jgi:glutaminyl-peptide cyclotransferase
MEDQYFGEGIATLSGDKYIRLTWKENTVHILDTDLNEIDSINLWPTVRQGWGITRNGNTLYVSDGSDKITLVDATTLQPQGTFGVVNGNGAPVHYINELEFYDGALWANVFTTDYLVKIEVESGRIVAAYDLGSLKATEHAYNSSENDRMQTWDHLDNVLNGIAFNPETGEMF